MPAFCPSCGRHLADVLTGASVYCPRCDRWTVGRGKHQQLHPAKKASDQRNAKGEQLALLA